MTISKLTYGPALLCLLLGFSDARRLGDETPDVIEIQNISVPEDGLMQYSEQNVEHEGERRSDGRRRSEGRRRRVWGESVEFNKVAKSFTELHHEFGWNTNVMNMLRRLLAAAASDIYWMQPYSYVGDPARLVVKKCVDQETDGHIRWAIYEIRFGRRSLFGAIDRKRILVFRGTANKKNLFQDISLMTGGDMFEDLYERGVEIAKQERPDFVTGHSLGGAVAEAVAVHAMIPGMSFNGPVICSSNSRTSFCKAGQPGSGPPFEAWLTEGDPVSEMSSLSHAMTKGFKGSTDQHHISKPHWNTCDQSYKHGMQCMFKGHRSAIKPIDGATLEDHEDDRQDLERCK